MHGRDVVGRGGDLPRGGAGLRETSSAKRMPSAPRLPRGCGTDPPPTTVTFERLDAVTVKRLEVKATMESWHGRKISPVYNLIAQLQIGSARPCAATHRP